MNSYNLHQEFLEDTYIDPLDGLAHCKRCHKPRQKVYPFMDSTKILPFPCPCIEDRWDQEDALREHRELLTRIAWLKSCGLGTKEKLALLQETFCSDLPAFMNRWMAFVSRQNPGDAHLVCLDFAVKLGCPSGAQEGILPPYPHTGYLVQPAGCLRSWLNLLLFPVASLIS